MYRPVHRALFGCSHTARAGLHEILRVEVRTRGVGRTGGMNDGQMTLLPQRLKGRERRMESEESIEIKHRVARNIDGRPHSVVGALVVGHDDVEAVGGTALEDNDKTLVFFAERFHCVGSTS